MNNINIEPNEISKSILNDSKLTKNSGERDYKE